MMCRWLLLPALGLLALLVPMSALAKGASEATITGPGLDDAIVLAGEGRSGGEQLMQLAEHAGFFPAVFDTYPSPMQARRPTGELGPAYTIEYALPGPNGEVGTIRQLVYPYATPAPVTYVAPGQAYWEGQATVGGWYLASPVLRDELIAAGLPESPPSAGGEDGGPSRGVLAALLAVASCLGASGLLLLRQRRRSRPAVA